MVHSTNDQVSLSLPQKVASAGLAGCTADLFTFPLDTVKVWLQVRGESTASQVANSSTIPLSVKSPLITKSTSKSTVKSSHLQPMIKRIKQNAPSPHHSTKLSNVVTSSKLLNQKPIKRESQFKLAKLAYNKFSTNSTNVIKPTIAAKLQARAVVATPSCNPQGSAKIGSVASVGLGRPPAVSIRANPGLLGTIVHGIRANGVFSLYGGIAAGLQRQVAFCAVRIGLYDNVKALYLQVLPGSNEGKQIPQRILAGTTTAFIAVALFQPTEVVKIRMQAQTSKPLHARLYTSSFQAYKSLFNIGIKEAWKGLETNAARLGVVNVCELVTYDVVKELILDYRLMYDNPACHFTSAFLSGFITTVVASPIDVVKTRYMNSNVGQYKGPIDCAKSMLSGEGFRAFYKGFVPAYLRLGSWNIVMFVSYEQYKRLFLQYNNISQHQPKGQLERVYVRNVE